MSITIMRDGIPTKVTLDGVRLTHPLDYRPEVRAWLDECKAIIEKHLRDKEASTPLR